MTKHITNVGFLSIVHQTLTGNAFTRIPWHNSIVKVWGQGKSPSTYMQDRQPAHR